MIALQGLSTIVLFSRLIHSECTTLIVRQVAMNFNSDNVFFRECQLHFIQFMKYILEETPLVNR